MDNLSIRITDHRTGFDQTLEFAADASAYIGELVSSETLAAPAAPAVPALEWSDTLCNGERVNHAAAEKACAALGEGWRLPTITELLALVDYTRCDPAIDTNRFPDTKSGAYWTSTLHASVPSYAWIVDFDLGDAYNYHRDYYDAFVRAVRGVPAGQ